MNEQSSKEVFVAPIAASAIFRRGSVSAAKIRGLPLSRIWSFGTCSDFPLANEGQVLFDDILPRNTELEMITWEIS